MTDRHFGHGESKDSVGVGRRSMVNNIMIPRPMGSLYHYYTISLHHIIIISCHYIVQSHENIGSRKFRATGIVLPSN